MCGDNNSFSAKIYIVRLQYYPMFQDNLTSSKDLSELREIRSQTKCLDN